MKKFLSLVLAMIMTLSLVTISAGATEYKDLTDKDEIQYEEAVAVLNRIGIITGYSDGSFRPETELTRGAAAKIIVSLLIGADAANNLTVPVAPYPDVPTSHTFAAVISYCKTAKIISGYSDGTFKPDGSLTGYAFAKMLLGAIGYKSELEGFSGSGWTMNVAKIGNAAGLFNRLNFQGGEAVNREQACQLALNTLKATMVEYTGGFNVVAGDATIVGAQNRSYVTSNQSYAANINNKKVTQSGNNTSSESHFTVEFGEEHFKDLRLNYDGDTNDDFGRPANNWSWKKVTIGTFALDADFSYEKLMEHKDATNAAKNRATGLSGYKTEITDRNGDTWFTRVWVNGEIMNDVEGTSPYTVPTKTIAGKSVASHQFGITDINDLTDNGTTVDVYVSEDNADFITDVVVVKSQLMEVKKVGSDYVSLQMYDDSKSDDDGENFAGFNDTAINLKVQNVQAEDEAYSVVSGLKTGDRVVVIPVADEHEGPGANDWSVAEAYVPETVSGALTAVGDYGQTEATKNAISLTVGGTVYDVSLWSKDISDIDGDTIKVTKKDVTLTLDKYGFAMLAEDTGAINDFMVIGSFRSGIENGRIVTYVTGWDISGEPIELNVGPTFSKGDLQPGDLVRYESNGTSNITDWNITETGVYNVYTGNDENRDPVVPYEIKASNQELRLRDYADDANDLYFDKSVKFIYVTFDVDGEVESVEIKKGVQAVDNDELRATCNDKIAVNTTDYDRTPKQDSKNYNSAQAAVKSDAIKAVVIKQESNDALSTAMLYVRDMPGGAEYDSNNKIVYKYTVAMNTPDGLEDNVTVYSYDRLYRGDFASYSEVENSAYSKTPFMDLRQHNNFTGRTTSTFRVVFDKVINESRGYVQTTGAYTEVGSSDALSAAKMLTLNIKDTKGATLGLGDNHDIVIAKDAVFVDLTDNDIDDYEDLYDFMYTDSNGDLTKGVRQNQVTADIVVNDNASNDNFRKIAMVIVTGVTPLEDTATKGQKTLLTASIKGVSETDHITAAATSYTVADLTQAQMDGSAATRFTHNGDKIKVELNGDDVGNGFTSALKKDDVIKVTVTAIDKTTAEYTFVIGAPIAAHYSNDIAIALGVAGDKDDAQQSDNIDWSNIDEDDITFSGTALQAPIVLTGEEQDTIDQIRQAAEFAGITGITSILKSNGYATNHTWVIKNDSDDVTFDEADAYVYVLVDDGSTVTKTISPINGMVADVITLADSDELYGAVTVNGKTTPILDNTGDPLADSDDGSTTKLIPGATYQEDVYTQFADTVLSISVTAGTPAQTYVDPVVITGKASDVASGVIYVDSDNNTVYFQEGAVFEATVELDAAATATAILTATETDGSVFSTISAAQNFAATAAKGDKVSFSWTADGTFGDGSGTTFVITES